MSWTDMIAHASDVPTLVGADLLPYPYISGYGLALRVAAFSLPSNGELNRLGFVNRRGVDVLQLTQRPSRSRNAFIFALGMERTGIERFWSPDTWSPMKCPGVFDRDPHRLRQCCECARHGYHCALFQLPSIRRCPWHEFALSDVCAECGAVQNARFNSSEQLGVCSCGYTALDRSTALGQMQTFPAAECANWVENYISWAKHEQRRRLLYLSEHTRGWDQAFAALAEPPVALQPKDERDPAMKPVCFDGVGPDPAPDALWGWAQLDGTQAFRSAPLPRYVFDALENESRKVLTNFGGQLVTARSTTDNEQPKGDSRHENAAAPSILIAPYGLYENGQAWLNLSVVDKDVARSCGRALAMAASTFCGPLDVKLSPPVSIARSLGLLDGRRHLVSAMLAILCRGYAEGLSSFMRRLRPGPTSSPGLLTLPVIEIEVVQNEVRRVRIAWAGLRKTGPAAEASIGLPWKPRKETTTKSRRRRCARPSR